MENSKYYTPEIEEFHIGFEYEVLDYAKIGEWSKFAVHEDSMTGKDLYPHTNRFDFYLENLETGKVRSKLLDREDIESLGWKHGADSDEYVHYFRNSNMLLFNSDTRSITITDSIGGLKTVGESVPIKYLFHGGIKNKSELHRLMKQLKIE